MDDSTPRQRAEADDSLGSWIRDTCPELPEIIRKHIQTMTDLEGQGQDVLLGLIMVSVREKMRNTDLALKIAASVQRLSFSKICTALVAEGLPGNSQRIRDVKQLVDEMLDEKARPEAVQ